MFFPSSIFRLCYMHQVSVMSAAIGNPLVLKWSHKLQTPFWEAHFLIGLLYDRGETQLTARKSGERKRPRCIHTQATCRVLHFHFVHSSDHLSPWYLSHIAAHLMEKAHRSRFVLEFVVRVLPLFLSHMATLLLITILESQVSAPFLSVFRLHRTHYTARLSFVRGVETAA